MEHWRVVFGTAIHLSRVAHENVIAMIDGEGVGTIQ